MLHKSLVMLDEVLNEIKLLFDVMILIRILRGYHASSHTKVINIYSFDSSCLHFYLSELCKNQRFLNKLARCRLEVNQAILSIFVDFSMEKSPAFPISLRQLDLKYLKIKRQIIFNSQRCSLCSHKSSKQFQHLVYHEWYVAKLAKPPK